MDYPIRTSDQLAPVLRGFRSRRNLTQSQLAERLGLSQRLVSALERRPHRASFERVLRLLAALDVEVVLRDRLESSSPNEAAAPDG